MSDERQFPNLAAAAGLNGSGVQVHCKVSRLGLAHCLLQRSLLFQTVDMKLTERRAFSGCALSLTVEALAHNHYPPRPIDLRAYALRRSGHSSRARSASCVRH